jgi:hypothetical protein
MATKEDLKNIIEDDLQRDDITTQVYRAIDYAIDFYKDERFAFNTFYSSSVTLTVSAAFIPLTDLSVRPLIIDRIRLNMTANYYVDMVARDFDWIMARQDVHHIAMPVEYCIFNEKIQFDTYADDSYTLVLDGLMSLGSTASDSYSVADATAWFNAGKELIRSKAKENLYLHVVKDMQQAQVMAEVTRMAFKNLKGKDTRQRSTGFIRPTDF